MTRARRITPVGTIFHIINRGNERRRLFFEDADYEAFIALLAESRRRYPILIYSHQLMPNHFHLILEPREERAVSAAMHWLQSRSSRYLRFVTQTQGQGHVFQRRFWSRPLWGEYEYLIVTKYVEANALRAGLVDRAEDWRWGSLWERKSGEFRVIDPTPVELPPEWVEVVNLRAAERERSEIQQIAKRTQRLRV